MPFPPNADDPCCQRLQPPALASEMRRESEESMRTEDCEGPVPDTPPMEQHIIMNEERSVDRSNGEPEMAVCSNRAELIERLKKGEAPQWIPNQSVRQ